MSCAANQVSPPSWRAAPADPEPAPRRAAAGDQIISIAAPRPRRGPTPSPPSGRRRPDAGGGRARRRAARPHRRRRPRAAARRERRPDHRRRDRAGQQAIFEYGRSPAVPATSTSPRVFARRLAGHRVPRADRPYGRPSVARSATRTARRRRRCVDHRRGCGRARPLGLFVLLLRPLNFFVGVFNLLPLLPLDGGHIAVNVYERIRDVVRARLGKPAMPPVDYARLLPLACLVILVGGAVSLLTLAADVVNPIRLAADRSASRRAASSLCSTSTACWPMSPTGCTTCSPARSAGTRSSWPPSAIRCWRRAHGAYAAASPPRRHLLTGRPERNRRLTRALAGPTACPRTPAHASGRRLPPGPLGQAQVTPQAGRSRTIASVLDDDPAVVPCSPPTGGRWSWPPGCRTPRPCRAPRSSQDGRRGGHGAPATGTRGYWGS